MSDDAENPSDSESHSKKRKPSFLVSEDEGSDGGAVCPAGVLTQRESKQTNVMRQSCVALRGIAARVRDRERVRIKD